MDGTRYGDPVPLDQLKLIKRDYWKELDDVYVIDANLDHRKGKSGYEYLIKWKDFPESANSWEPQENILAEKWLSGYTQPCNSRKHSIVFNDDRVVCTVCCSWLF